MKFFFEQYGLWLLMNATLLGLVNFLVLLDEGVAVISVIYLNVLFLLVVVAFFSARFFLDRRMLKNISGSEHSPVILKVKEHYDEQLMQVEYQLKRVKLALDERNDEQLAWIHEMKAPLTALKLMIEQMPDRKMQLRYEQEWLRIYNLVDQQLYMARLDSVEKDSHHEPLNLRTIVVQEVKYFQSWCIEKGIAVELDDLQGEVVTDAKWLAYIVRQYISNAIKYTETNSIIYIYTSQSAENHLLLHVKDEGTGIAAHDLPRVFQRSYTGTKGRESSAASGMGLYLAQMAANQLGLKLSIQSTINEGTIATIQFPLENEYTKSYGM